MATYSLDKVNVNGGHASFLGVFFSLLSIAPIREKTVLAVISALLLSVSNFTLLWTVACVFELACKVYQFLTVSYLELG